MSEVAICGHKFSTQIRPKLTPVFDRNYDINPERNNVQNLVINNNKNITKIKLVILEKIDNQFFYKFILFHRLLSALFFFLLL